MSAKPFNKSRKLMSPNEIDYVFEGTGRSTAPTALEESVDHYSKNCLSIKEVNYSVPFPTKCAECEY